MAGYASKAAYADASPSIVEQLSDVGLAAKTDVSDAVSSHNSATDAHADKFAEYLPLAGGTMTGTIKAPAQNPVLASTNGAVSNNNGSALAMVDNVTMLQVANAESKVRTTVAVATAAVNIETFNSDDSCSVNISPTGVSLEGTSGITNDRHITTKKYVDDTINNAITGLTPSACKVTLAASGWDSSAKTQSATVSGVLEDESKQLIMPMPAGTSMSAYNAAGIQMTAQAANTVTFTADTVPTADVEVWVVVQSVNDVTPPPPLDQASWAYISQQSLAGNAKNIWAVGDCKKIKLNGTIGQSRLNTELYVYILDFDHDRSVSGGKRDGITFGTFKTALTGGTDVCLAKANSFNMNLVAKNAGYWQSSYMRYNTLGSTDAFEKDATAATVSSPVANSLMSCLPADLRAVMRPMVVYTVWETVDYLPLLSEKEILGTVKLAADDSNSYQYAYYKNGNSLLKYKHEDLATANSWWTRSPVKNSTSNFCCMSAQGASFSDAANDGYSGIAPMFKV